MGSKFRFSLKGQSRKSQRNELSHFAENSMGPPKIEKRDKPPFLFVFIGEASTGKSRAILNVFHATSPKSKKSSDIHNSHVLQRWGCKDSESGHVLEILEVNGLVKNGSSQDDPLIVTALGSFLKKESPARNPVVTFITARFDDEAFEDDLSPFSQTLRSLLPVRQLLTDGHCSNIVLLLTHADKVNVRKDIIQERIQRYKLVFASVFKIDGGYGDFRRVCAIPIGRSSRSTETLWKSLKESEHNGSTSSFNLLYKFLSSRVMEQLGQIKNSQVDPYSYQSFTLEELITPENQTSFTAPTILLNGENFQNSNLSTTSQMMSADKLIVVATERDPLRQKMSNEPLLVFNCVQPQCIITLANGDLITVEDLLVGDRVLGYRSAVGIITKICKIDRTQRVIPDSANGKSYFRCKDCKTERFNNLFKIFLKGVTTNHRPTSGRVSSQRRESRVDYVYCYERESIIGTKGFMLKMFNHQSILEENITAIKTDAFYVEVDNGTGTFIADGLVRACMAIL